MRSFSCFLSFVLLCFAVENPLILSGHTIYTDSTCGRIVGYDYKRVGSDVESPDCQSLNAECVFGGVPGYWTKESCATEADINSLFLRDEIVLSEDFASPNCDAQAIREKISKRDIGSLMHFFAVYTGRCTIYETGKSRVYSISGKVIVASEFEGETCEGEGATSILTSCGTCEGHEGGFSTATECFIPPPLYGGYQVFEDSQCKNLFGYQLAEVSKIDDFDCNTINTNCVLDLEVGFYKKEVCYPLYNISDFIMSFAGERRVVLTTNYINQTVCSSENVQGDVAYSFYYADTCAQYGSDQSVVYSFTYSGELLQTFSNATDCTGVILGSKELQCGACFSDQTSSRYDCITTTTLLAYVIGDRYYQLSGQYIGQAILMGASSLLNEQVSFIFYPLNEQAFKNQILYVFDSPYNGNPAHLSSAAFLGKARTKDGFQFTFPASVQLSANVKYYFYFGNKVTGKVSIKDYGVKRALNNHFLIYGTGAYQETTFSLGFDVISAPDDGQISGDPYFIGFNNQKFEFDGTAGSIYNIYNDKWVNLNSKFGVANSRTQKGTIMTEFGISMGEHNISVSINSARTREYFDIVVDGVTKRINSDAQKFSGCVEIEYDRQVLLFTTPKHEIYITPLIGKHGHINMPYFDIHIHHPEEDITKIGGVLGQTATKTAKISVDENDFAVQSLFSLSASKFYNLNTLEC